MYNVPSNRPSSIIIKVSNGYIVLTTRIQTNNVADGDVQMGPKEAQTVWGSLPDALSYLEIFFNEAD